MCCAVQYTQLEKFYHQSEEEKDFEGYPILRKQISMANKTSGVSNYSKHEKSDVKVQSVRPKTSMEVDTTDIASSEESTGKKKKKKWKKIPLSDTSFNLSLFPRPTRPDPDPEVEEKLFNKIESELEEFEALLDKCTNFDVKDDTIFDGRVTKCDKLARPDRDRRIQKAGKQVKDKHCKSLKNNDGRKKLFMHHRLFKLLHQEQLSRQYAFLPSPKPRYDLDVKKLKEIRPTPYPPRPARKPAPAQNLRHTLHETNAPTDIDSGLVNILIGLQHRELTPEDYELLLQLDDSVAPKTLEKSFLQSFKTDTVTADTADDVCPVCMDQYQVGQNRKYLPCNHVFHASCIDMWLENSSQNCPIDGLPVDGNS